MSATTISQRGRRRLTTFSATGGTGRTAAGLPTLVAVVAEVDSACTAAPQAVQNRTFSGNRMPQLQQKCMSGGQDKRPFVVEQWALPLAKTTPSSPSL